MKRFFLWRPAVLLALLLIFGVASSAAAADAPLELAGIRLGQSVDALRDKLQAGSADRAFYRPSLGIMAVAPVPGFRSGYVEYGLCAKPGNIVRIKMHYADDSLKFFNRLMAALEKRYGEPKEWRGNAFGTLRTWKWSLTAADGQPVSLILMHYEGTDGAFTDGNSIRLAASNMVLGEQQCLKAKGDTVTGQDKAKTVGPSEESLGLDWFLPR